MNIVLKNSILILFFAASGIALFLMKPIEQNLSYHNFADQNTFFNIPNFWDVISNLPFLIVGFIGMVKCQARSKSLFLFFLAIFLIAPGSACYHYNPNNSTLIWDRLPMTIAFMSLFTWALSEFINQKIENYISAFLLGGILSVFIWVWTDDLRLYAWIQYGTIPVFILLLIMYKSPTGSKPVLLLIIASYVVAKFCESYDEKIFTLTNKMLSGHSIKHLFSAMAPFFALKLIPKDT